MSEKMKSLLTRLLSGIVMLAIVISTGIIGGPVLFLLNLFIALAGLYEYMRVFGQEKKLLGVINYVFTVGYYIVVLAAENFAPYALGIFLLVLMFVLLGVYVFSFPRFKSEDIAVAFFGFFYVPVMLSFLYMTRTIGIGGEDSCLPYFLIFICSWGCDTCAYVFGMLLGRHKMAPVLSPKKSIEGGIGGVVGAALLGLAYAVVFSMNITACVLLCALGAVVSQIGDLAASAIKRNHNVKDYGNLIPGHGGILDRFDSVILTAPAIYMLAMFYWL